MNILKITKSDDVMVFLNDEQLCFVTGFCAKEEADIYEIKEYLSDECVDVIKGRKNYIITINALSMLSDKVFNTEPFSLKVVCEKTSYVYDECVVKSKERLVNIKKPLTDKYVIISKNLKVICDE